MAAAAVTAKTVEIPAELNLGVAQAAMAGMAAAAVQLGMATKTAVAAVDLQSSKPFKDLGAPVVKSKTYKAAQIPLDLE